MKFNRKRSSFKKRLTSLKSTLFPMEGHYNMIQRTSVSDLAADTDLFFQRAVHRYFDSFARKTYAMEYLFSKAAQAALLKMCPMADAYLLTRGMLKRTANLKKTSAEPLLQIKQRKRVLVTILVITLEKQLWLSMGKRHVSRRRRQNSGTNVNVLKHAFSRGSSQLSPRNCSLNHTTREQRMQ